MLMITVIIASTTTTTSDRCSIGYDGDASLTIGTSSTAATAG